MKSYNSQQKDSECIKALQAISVKLNDHQLYLLVEHLLEKAKHRPTVYTYNALSEMSKDMWKRVIITVLKKEENQNKLMNKDSRSNFLKLFSNNVNEQKQKNSKEMELLAFGLFLVNPRIQLNCNDNITLDPLHELILYYYRQATEWGFLNLQSKWDHKNDNNIPYPQCANDKTYQKHYTVVHAAAQLGNLSQFKLVLQNNPHIGINDSYNEHRQTPLHLAVNNQHWDIARYCIEKGAYIDIREGAVNSLILRTPFENIIEYIMKHKKNKNSKEFLDATEIGKWILRQRIMYPIKRIEYAIDYTKNKLINENDITQIIDEEGYETLLEESAAFLLGVNQRYLKEILIRSNLLYWAASRNIICIKDENSRQKSFDRGWCLIPFLIFRIFLLFEICVNLRKEERHFIGLPKGTTFEQVYEKLVRELQVQLTTYWDYVTTEEFKHKCPDLFEDWSCNVVDRLMNLKPWCEVTLVVGHDGHCIYLSLCKTLDSILVRVDNRWMHTVPVNTPHPENELGLIQSYLVAYFNLNSPNLDKNKKWLKEYIKNATKLRDSDSNESMRHLYCSDNKSSFPREGNVLSIVKHWPYRPTQTNAASSYLRSNNVGYRIRLGDVIYTWVKNQEYKSFVFNKTNYNSH
ncbi:hypothetical protein RFI_39697 [Reticulomyxa filosa]|uniref:Uncharacterized protein n=1 Tax=Reticulomyxa filosa TaxID=46433 RepID=X6LAT3_RETFI|nr:hypothetical protein RFI_39697 [Reticulomyxa filosa]|eukprot:ETN97829.1 hypothetical protein RFI_39697 [Reticulomyxa filosa]